MTDLPLPPPDPTPRREHPALRDAARPAPPVDIRPSPYLERVQRIGRILRPPPDAAPSPTPEARPSTSDTP